MSRRVFGIGVDIAHVPRVQKTLQRYGSKFLRRAFNSDEIAHLQKLSDSGLERARFAASGVLVCLSVFDVLQMGAEGGHDEGIRPAFAVSEITLSDGGRGKAGVLHSPSLFLIAVLLDQRRSVVVSGSAQSLFAAQNICAAHASVSHDGDTRPRLWCWRATRKQTPTRSADLLELCLDVLCFVNVTIARDASTAFA